MTLLLVTRPADLHDLLPAGRDRPGWHALLVREIAAHLSAAHAAILARPVPGPEGLAWHAEGVRAVALPALALPERRALLAAAGSILSDIRRLAESGRAPLVAACWPALREIPDLGCLFAVDGRPVLAAWGTAPAQAAVPPGLLAAHDDGLGRMVAPPRRGHPVALGVLALLGLLLGLGLAAADRAFPPGVCRLGSTQQALLVAGRRAAVRQAALEGELGTLRAAVRAGQQHCLTAAKAPPPVPPALPEQAWRTHDLGMLKGCWHRYTNMVTINPITGHLNPVTNWLLCFDKSGQGVQNVVWRDGASCTNPVRAHFTPDDSLSIDDTIPCGQSPPSRRSLFLGRIVCKRLSSAEASCARVDLNGPDRGHFVPGMFRR